MKKYIFLIIAIISLCGCSFNTSNAYPTNEENNKIDNKNETQVLEDNLKVHFLDVGEGDAIFIELPANRTMLIDAGESSASSKIISYLEALNVTKIDYVIASHPHADHIGGLRSIIEHFEIGNIYMPKVVSTSKTFENLLTTISNKGLKIKNGISGVEILNEENLKALIVAPNKESYSGYNNYSIVLKLTYGNTSYLFTGDAEELSEKEITSDINSDVLKVGHHGSNTSTSEEFLSKVSPSYAVISVGANNKYNHPASATINKLEKYTTNIYRTDISGNIIIKSDGKNINVQTER